MKYKRGIIFVFMLFVFAGLQNIVRAELPLLKNPNLKITLPTNTPTPTAAINKLINPDIFKNLFSSPTPTPTPTTTPTPTETPTPEPTKEVVIESTPTPTVSSITPTTTQPDKPSANNQQNNISPTLFFAVAAIALVLILFILFWPKIKKFLHEKTA